MCGIYGYFGKIKEGCHEQVYNLIKALAIRTEVRGTDSIGYYARNENFEFSEKEAVSASEFFESSEDLIMEAITQEQCYVFLGHNRAASVGAVTSTNAHPFIGNKIVLMHNGTCRQIFKVASKKALKNMKGQTDSEALMWHFNEVGPQHYSSWQKLDTYATVIYEYETNRVYFARDFWRPLVIYDLRETLGVRIFASTEAIATKAFDDCGLSTDDYKHFTLKSFNLYYTDITDGELHRLKRYKIVNNVYTVDSDGESTLVQHAKKCKPFHDQSKPTIIRRPKQTKAEPESDIPPYLEIYYEEQERKRQERLNASMVVHNND
ncbi:MAG: hypothetical protein DRJ03_01145 [Chloroflexi bacterium]|nr:MAG: hypothetical protein DRJ03_01145 [Chloroflexota bacterium]